MNKPDRGHLRLLAGAYENGMHENSAASRIEGVIKPEKDQAQPSPVYKLTSHYKDLGKTELY